MESTEAIDQMASRDAFAAMLDESLGDASRIEGTVGVVPGEVVVPFTLRVPLAAFDSGNPNRDGNALMALGAATQPEARLTVTRLAYDWKTYKPGNVGGRLDFKATAHGELTLRGVTKTIEVDCQMVGVGKGPTGPKVGFECTFVINRADYGMKWGIDAPKGALGNEVRMIIALEGDAAKPQQ